MQARIHITSVLVDDQEKALAFYTEKLGFVPKADFPAGQFRWLTVVSADAPDGVELALEPDESPAAKAFVKALAEDGIPSTSFLVDDVEAAHKELVAMGVTFTQPPTEMDGSTTAVLDDTCGNLIMLASGKMAE